MTPVSIFQYPSAKRFLVDYVARRQASEPGFSLRKWSKSMGMGSHAHLVMILQGKRPLTLKQVPFLAKGMDLSSPERLYLQALIQFENARTPEEKDLCRLWLSEANPGHDFRIREVDEYLAIAHWVHMAILAMSENPGFRLVPEEIHLRLGKKATLGEIRAAIERLRALGLLVEKDGRWVCTYARVTTRDDVANRGAREYHKQVAKLGMEAIEAQDVAEREFQSFALAMPRSKLPLVKEMIRRFRAQLREAAGPEAGDEAYQAQIQFFRLTECPSEMVPKVDEGAGVSDRDPGLVRSISHVS